MSFQSFGLQSLDQSSPTQQSASMAIRNAFAMIHHSITDLGTVLTIPPFGIDAASLAWRQQTIDVNANNIASVVSMQLATIGSLVLQVSGIPNKMDYELITSSITQLPGLFAQLNQNLKVLRSVLDDENLKEHLLAVALDLANSLAHVIDSSQPLCMGDINALSNFHDAARIFSVNSSDLLTCLELLEVSETSEQELLECCNFLSKAVTDLITKSKNTSKSLGNEVVEDVSSKIMDTFASTNRLIISTMVLHPALNSQICQDQVNEGASIVRENINILCNVFDELIGQNDINLLADASRRIEESLTKLLYCASHVGQKEIEYNALDQQFLSIMEAIDNLNESFDDSQNMLSCARDLTLGTTQFIALLKQHGESYDNNDDLLSAAKALAEATSRMVSAAKSFSKDSDNSEKEDRLKEAIADVMKLTCKASTPEIRENSMKRLAKCAKEVISTSNQVSNASKNASACNRNQASQMKLTQVLKKLQYVQPDVITSIKNFSRSPCDIVTQNKLLQSSTSIIAPSEVVIDSCHAAQNTVSDVHAQTQLASTCTEFEFNVNDLKKLVIVVEELLSYVSAKEAIAAIKLLQDSFLMTEESIVVNNTTSARKGITIHDNGARDLQVSLKSNLDQSNDLLMAISDLSSTIGRFTVDCTEEEGQSFTSNALMLLSVMANATQEYSAVEKDIDFKSDMLQSAFKLSEVISLIIVQANASSDQKETSEIKRLQGDAVLLLDHMSVSVASKVSVDSATTQSSTITDYGSEMFIYETGFEDEWASSVQNSVLAVQGAISDLTKSAKGTPDEIETSITGFKKAIKKLNRMSTMYTSEDTSSTQISDALQSLNAFSHNFIGDVKVSYLSQEDTGMTFELFAASKMVYN